MNDLQKDQAIFKAMNEIANEVFNYACNHNGALKKEMEERGGIISLKDILSARNQFLSHIKNGLEGFKASENYWNDERGICKIEVDTFCCTMLPTQVFEHMNYQKSLAKVSGEITFCYKEEINMPHVTTLTVTLDNATNAKKLTKFTASDELRPSLSCVLAEFNLDTGVAYFVASDGHVISVITTDVHSIHRNNPNDKVLRALFTKKDWERICDYAKKNGNDVTLEYYYGGGGRNLDTAVAILGDKCIKSTKQDMIYPNWHSVVPFFSGWQHVKLTDEAVKDMAKFIRNDKDEYPFHYTISVYDGCDDLYVEYSNLDFNKEVVMKFKLQAPATSDFIFGASRSQMKKMTIKGFWFGELNKIGAVDSKEMDFTFLMPVEVDTTIDERLADERRGFVLHPQDDNTAEEQTAKVVELAA